MNASRPIRVLVVDDDPMARAGVRQLLQSDEQIAVVAEASDGDEVVTAVNKHSPDVVMMDIRMERMSGIEAMVALQRRICPPKVIALTAFDLDRYVFDALQAGAVGFLLKDSSPGDLRRAVRTAMTGDSFISPRSTRHLISHFTGRDDRVRQQARATLGTLSEREQQIARLVWSGLSNREIAEQLYLAETTVKTHLSRLMAKIDEDNRVQVALLVERAG